MLRSCLFSSQQVENMSQRCHLPFINVGLNFWSAAYLFKRKWTCHRHLRRIWWLDENEFIRMIENLLDLFVLLTVTTNNVVRHNKHKFVDFRLRACFIALKLSPLCRVSKNHKRSVLNGKLTPFWASRKQFELKTVVVKNRLQNFFYRWYALTLRTRCPCNTMRVPKFLKVKLFSIIADLDCE